MNPENFRPNHPIVYRKGKVLHVLNRFESNRPRQSPWLFVVRLGELEIVQKITEDVQPTEVTYLTLAYEPISINSRGTFTEYELTEGSKTILKKHGVRVFA